MSSASGSARRSGAKVIQAYRFALNPAPAQERMLGSHAGAARFAWNWGLARCQQRYQAEGSWYSGIELHKLWNAGKKADPALAWWAENSKCVYQEAFRDLDRALRDFIRSQKGQRKGKRLGFPRFKKRGRCRDSFRFSTGAIGCAGTTVTLPRLGTIRTHESTGKLARGLGGSDGPHLVGHGVAYRRAVVRVVHGRSRACGPATPRPAPVGYRRRPRRDDPADRRGRPGKRRHRAGAEGAAVLAAQAAPHRRSHSRKVRGSANRRKSAARLARIHARVANVRADALHKATTGLAARYETVVAEDLNVAGMTRNRHLARALADQGFGIARRMLGYKTTWNGGYLLLAGRWFPSSKTCSGCGAVKTKLPLSERTYRCDCGLVTGRDVNAAPTCSSSPPVGRRA